MGWQERVARMVTLRTEWTPTGKLGGKMPLFYIVFAERLILKWVDSFNIEIHVNYT